MADKTSLGRFFSGYRKNVIGHQQYFDSPFGRKKIVYADWTASGRCYQPIEECLQKRVMPFVANTHTNTTITGTLMSKAYEQAKIIIKKHVHADQHDKLIFCGSGMTAAVNKLQRILGVRMPEQMRTYFKRDVTVVEIEEELRPVVFITHMEHHSNHLSWLETIADVVIIEKDEKGNVDLIQFRNLLEQFSKRKNKWAAVTACSNVTGIQTPYHEIARMIHAYDGLCFVDFACSAPYVDINMHPGEACSDLDAIYFSFHKFLGGPGTPGVLIFNQKLYRNSIPDHPGGGTVIYSNPWNDRAYVTDIEMREDGGTPPFLQGIKAAMCVQLKEEMGVANIFAREQELLRIIFSRILLIRHLKVLEPDNLKRLGVISFIVEGAHYNLIVKLLNDRFGIQMRGGCSCAGTYGHKLLAIDRVRSFELLRSIQAGDLSCKPGWIRLSIHPTMTDSEMNHILDALEETAAHFQEWESDYLYDPQTNEYRFKDSVSGEEKKIIQWYDSKSWNNHERDYR